MENNLQYQYRPFFYRERSDIDEFLDESDLWNKIYDVFLEIKDNYYNLKLPTLAMFNEVRYQCVRLQFDKHPEENFWKNYIEDAHEKLLWRYATDLCFSMIYAILSLKKEQLSQEKRVCKLIENTLKNERFYFPKITEFIAEEKKEGNVYDINLSIQPAKPEFLREALIIISTSEEPWCLAYDAEWWKERTNNFDQDRIRQIIEYWTDPQEKYEMIELLEIIFLEEPEPFAEYDDLPF